MKAASAAVKPYVAGNYINRESLAILFVICLKYTIIDEQEGFPI